MVNAYEPARLSDTPVKRRALQTLDSLVKTEPVVAIHGPRAAGKSTILAGFATSKAVEVIDLDDPNTREITRQNLSAITATTPVCIDEYQKLPIVLDALKARLNENHSTAGTAVITSSTRHDALPRTAQALTGQLHQMKLYPLSQGEIDQKHESFLEAIITNGALPADPTDSGRSETTRREYVERILAGGMPLALKRSGLQRRRWLDNYIKLTVERDSVELSQIRQRDLLMDVLKRLAGQTAQVMNIAGLANKMGENRGTVGSYVQLLEDLFLVQRLDAWGTTLRSRTVQKPKIHVLDSGVAGALHRVSIQKLLTFDPATQSYFGHLLESFVVGEIRKQASWMELVPELGHWRTHDGHEADLVVESFDGTVAAFEVKAAEVILDKDVRGLLELRSLIGERFVAGAAFYLGTTSYQRTDGIWVLPVDRLWH